MMDTSGGGGGGGGFHDSLYIGDLQWVRRSCLVSPVVWFLTCEPSCTASVHVDVSLFGWSEFRHVIVDDG